VTVFSATTVSETVARIQLTVAAIVIARRSLLAYLIMIALDFVQELSTSP